MKGLSAGVFWLICVSFSLLILRVFNTGTLHKKGRGVHFLMLGIYYSNVMVQVQCHLRVPKSPSCRGKAYFQQKCWVMFLKLHMYLSYPQSYL